MQRIIFVSYSQEDKGHLEKLQTYLKPLVRDGHFELWDDTRIIPGQDWRKKIEGALREAIAAILLVSPAFLASDFITYNELPVLLKKAEDEGLKVFSVIVSKCLFKESALSKFQVVNPKRPLDRRKVSTRNDVWSDLATAIKHVLDEGLLTHQKVEEELAGSRKEDEMDVAILPTEYVDIPVEIDETNALDEADWEEPSIALEVDRIVYAIKSKYPELSEEAAHKYAGIVLVELAKRIGARDQLGHSQKIGPMLYEIIPFVIKGLQ